MEKSRTLKQKDLSGGYHVSLVKYWTDHPKKTVSKKEQKA